MRSELKYDYYLEAHGIHGWKHLVLPAAELQGNANNLIARAGFFLDVIEKCTKIELPWGTAPVELPLIVGHSTVK